MHNLLEQICALNVQPFVSQVVQNPWSNVVDAELLHRDVKQKIRSLIEGCRNENQPRCLTITAPPGYGKTHLLAWTRQKLENSEQAIFIYVPPYLPNNSDGISAE